MDFGAVLTIRAFLQGDPTLSEDERIGDHIFRESTPTNVVPRETSVLTMQTGSELCTNSSSR